MKTTTNTFKIGWIVLLNLILMIVSSQVFAQSGFWSARSSMPTVRYHIRAGVVNNVLYVVGGWDGTASLNTVEAFDPATNTWVTKTSMPTPRMDPAVGVVNNTLYVIGGSFDCCTPLDNVEAYNPATDTWATKSHMPTARRDPAIGVVNGIIYVVGGWNGSPVNTVEAYDPVADTWVTKTPMPTARAGTTVEVVNGVLYAVGGWTDIFGATPGLGTVEAYDPATDSWTTKTSIPTPRFHHAAGVINNAIYIVGGTDGTTPLTSVEVYDAATDTWTSAAALPTARRSLTAGVINNVLYAVGGYTENSAVAVNEAFSLNSIINVNIDIWPRNPNNPISVPGKMLIPVAILGSSSFEASTVDVSTVRFGRTGTEAPVFHSVQMDANRDGISDMLLFFRTPVTGIQCGDTSALLTGQTLNGQMFQGSDSITTVGCPNQFRFRKNGDSSQ